MSSKQGMAATKWVWIAVLALAVATIASASEKKVVGKNPGDTKGRWLEVQDADSIAGFESACLGEVKTQIHWKKSKNESPMDEKLLADEIREQLATKLADAGVFDQLLACGSKGSAGKTLRLDASMEVEPGSRAARYAVGFGAGKSKSILEIRLHDHATGKSVGLYHGYGTGTGMGFKLAGGGARKMSEDDVQENAKQFAELLSEFR